MEIPKGFEKFYPKNVLLLLKKTLYSVENAAKAFWLVLLKIMASIGLRHSKADLCLYYTWDAVYGLIIILSWIDDLLIFGKCEGVIHYNKMIADLIDCDDIGPLTDYIGNKIEFIHDEHWVRLTQPVLLRSFKDEFTFSKPHKCPKTPAVPGSVLRARTPEESISAKEQKTYRSGVGKLLFLMKWSRPDVLNSVCNLSRFMSCACPAHVMAMERIMQFCLCSKDKGLKLQPSGIWYGNKSYKFNIRGHSNSDYAKRVEDRKSVTGYSTHLNDAPIFNKSKTQNSATLSVSEAELIAAVECAHTMLFVRQILNSVRLSVEKPMILEIDCKGTVNLNNNWTVGRRTCRISVKHFFLWDLKESGDFSIVWLPSAQNTSDIFTKNLDGPMFANHAGTYVF